MIITINYLATLGTGTLRNYEQPIEENVKIIFFCIMQNVLRIVRYSLIYWRFHQETPKKFCALKFD